MKYKVRCSHCAHEGFVNIPREDLPHLKAEGTPCGECGGQMEYVFDVQGTAINMVGDAWADKNYREKEYRLRRSERMGQRMRDNHASPTLQPNYNGEMTGTWEEAREMARKDGKKTATYDPMVRKTRKPV